MEEFKNKDFRTLTFEKITTLFKVAGIKFNDGTLRTVVEKCLPHINKQSILEMDKDALIGLIEVKENKEESVTLIHLLSLLRLVDVYKKPEIDTANQDITKLSSYQVYQLFIQKVQTKKISQALAWDNLIEDNSIDEEVLVSDSFSETLLEKMGLTPGQKIKFDNMMENFDAPNGTGAQSTNTHITGGVIAALNAGIGGKVKIGSVSMNSDKPQQEAPKKVASDVKNTPKQPEEKKPKGPEDDSFDLK